ncbi:MAG: hypothetical protein ACTSVV_10470 [Promethearchaeota archaeon]
MKDRKFRLSREWSNQELQKFAKLFRGDVINVSGWKDLDKQGNKYKNYFSNCSSYFISNHLKSGKGFENHLNEFKLDLTDDLEKKFVERFDVVFNHTTLEHIFDFHKAFKNLCLMSKDIVILIVPFLQQAHGEGFDDYWRFTPKALELLFKKNGLKIIYSSYNNHKRSSVYIFCIASKNPNKWTEIIKNDQPKEKKIWLDPYPLRIGSRAIINNLLFRLIMKLKGYFKKDLYY